MKMKNVRIISLALVTLLWGVSCSDDFLKVEPPGSYSEPSLVNAKGVEGMLIATYSALDGSWFENWGNNHFNQNGGASNWIWGSVRADDGYKGTEPTDGPDLTLVWQNELQPTMGYVSNKWDANYDGIGKANATLRNIQGAADMSDADKIRVEGEARFLRAHFHFEGVKVFGRVPYVDETVLDFSTIGNSDEIIWPQIEADLLFAWNNLDYVMPAPGRANKAAAGAMLAKVYMYQRKWSDAKPILDEVIGSGQTSSGATLALMPNYYHNFRADMELSNTESLFGYEANFGDGSISNGNYEQTLNQPHGSSAPTACCGFFQPSQNLVNSMEVDGVTGLPLLDTFNDVNILEDNGIPSASAWDAALTYNTGDGVAVKTGIQTVVYTSNTDGNTGNDPASSGTWDVAWTEDITTALDSRLDWTVGRRGIPFLDWAGKADNPGSNGGYVRDPIFGGPYNPVKTVPTQAEFDASLAGVIDWGFTSSAKNVHIIRLADVLLMSAEVEAELTNLTGALNRVNEVRTRAANSEVVTEADNVTPAANYSVGLYTAAEFGNAQDALKAIRFERKIELAMEGHRFFDLVRWSSNNPYNPTGSSASEIDMVAYMTAYYAAEAAERTVLSQAEFNANDMLAPIPDDVLTNSQGQITQNPGYQ